MSAKKFESAGGCSFCPWKIYYILIILYSYLPGIVYGASCDIPTLDRIIDIPENLPQGSIVKTLNTAKANALDKRSEAVDGKIINMTLETNPYIELNADTLSFTLLKSLDAESDSQSLKTKLRCIDSVTNLVISYDISINILDANDNAPFFERAINDVSINELTPIGSTVVQDIKAIDRDMDSMNSRVTYSIENGPFSDYFSLPDPRRPTVILVKSLDYERIRSMYFTVIAEDHGQPRLRNHTVIRVTVLDGDDKNPAFVHNNYWAIINENYTLKTELEVKPEGLQAFDQDSGIKADIVYSFEGANNNDTTDDRIFKIHPFTGSLYINNPVPDAHDYFLIIKATQKDNPDRYATTGVKIQGPKKALKPFDEYPVIDSNPIRVNVLEDVIPGTTIISLGSKIKSYYAIKFAILRGNHVSLPFNLTEEGDLIVTEPLDYEKITNYEMIVAANQFNNQTQELRLIVDVINVNDNAPVFSKDSYTLSASRKDGSYVGKIKVTDLDDDAITLKLVGSKYFTINQHGDIFIHNPDKLLESTYEMTAVAIDNGKTPRTTTAQITIKLPKVNATKSFATSQVREPKSFWKTRDNYLIILGALLGFALVFILILSILIAKKKISPDQKWLNSWNYIWKVSRPHKDNVVNRSSNQSQTQKENHKRA